MILANKMATGIAVIGTPGHSPALKYEMQLVEALSDSHQEGMSPERIDLCFSIFDDLLPQLGVFQRVMKLIRGELYINTSFTAAVYSNNYTAGVGRSRRSSVEPVNIPHFIVSKRIMMERDKQVSKLKGQIESLKEQLYNCEADLEKASSAVESYRYNIKESESKIQTLSFELQNVIGERDRLQLLASQYQEVHETIRQEGENRVSALKENIVSLESSINELQTFKLTHQRLQKAFSSSKDVLTKRTQPLATDKNILQREQDKTNVLQHQLLLLKNKLIAEYEDIMLILLSNKENQGKLKIQQEKFKTSINEIDKELSLLTSHQTSLSSRLNHLSSLDPAQIHQTIICSYHPENLLVTQEQQLNKYSAMLYISSNDGKSYYPAKEGQDCLSCGEKVVICPHWSDKELIIQLPLHSTHIKLIHPLLQLVTTPTNSSRDQSEPKPSKPTATIIQHSMSPDFDKIWRHFNSKYNINCPLPRDIPKETLLQLLKLFYVNQIKLDQTPFTDSTPSYPLSSSFYQFIEFQYHISSVGSFVLHDLLRTLQEHYHHYTELHLFSYILAGNIEGVVFRYHLLLADFVNILPWGSSDYFMPWAHIIYPFLEEEGLEQLNIEYMAHSRNQFTKYTVLDYIMWLLLKHREPLVLQMESHLSDQKTLHTGSMNETEFAEICLLLCPSAASDSLVTRLYLQSLAQLKEKGRKEDSIPLRNLAYILAYIYLLHITTKIQEQLVSLSQSDQIPLPSKVDVCTIKEVEIMKMSDIKDLI